MPLVRTATHDVSALIDEARFSPFQVRILIIAIIISIVDGFDGQALGFALPALSADFDLPLATFTATISVGLIGMVAGGIVGGPLGDRFGRRSVLLASLAVFATGTLATALVSTLEALFVLRLIVCLGIGGLLPNLMALMTEDAPARLRIAVTTFVVGALGLGGVAGGLFAASVIPSFGWHSIFIGGGVVGILLFVIGLVLLPESIRFDVQRGRTNTVRASLSRITGRTDFSADDEYVIPGETAEKRGSVKELFRNGRGSTTILLWLIFAFNLLIVYLMINWLPSLLSEAGYTAETAAITMSVYNVGGIIGAVVIGLLGGRIGKPAVVLGIAYTVGTVLLLLLQTVDGSVGQLYALAGGIGLCIVGGQAALSGLASAAYPTSVRATAAGWAWGVGRLASILGPSIGGGLLALGVSPVAIVGYAAVPSGLAAVLVLILAAIRRSRPIGHDVA